MDSLTGMTWSKRPGQILLITGIGELVLAIGFAVAGFFLPEAAFAMYLTAVILAVVGIPLTWAGVKAKARYEAAQALKQTGAPAMGRIMGLRQTGLSMNDQPQVEITLEAQAEGRAPYTVTRKESVPLMLLGTLQERGAPAAEGEPVEPRGHVIEWERAGGPQAVIGGTNLPTEQALEANRTRLREVGLDGRYSIDRAEDTGVPLGDNHVVLLGITVTRPGSNPYAVSFPAAVPAEHIGRCVPGNSIPVKVDPADPNALMIDWDAP